MLLEVLYIHKLFHIYLFSVCVYVSVLMSWCMCGGHRTTCGSWFPPIIVQVLGFDLRFSGLVASVFIL